MRYYEVTLQIPSLSKDAVMNRLSDLGCLGFVEADDRMLAYFDEKCVKEDLKAALDAFRNCLRDAELDPGFTFSVQTLPDQDWNEAWKRHFSPIDVGERITIIPSWIEHDTNRIPVIIDPGMVFGTGHHETTRTCMMQIEQIAKRKQGSCLDIGTGTGILAITAARFGFAPVVAVEIDPLAVDAAERNVRLNHLENITVMLGGVQDVSETFDLITANLLSGILIDSAHAIARHLRDDGWAIFSGMLAGEDDGVRSAMEREGLRLEDTINDNRWVTLTYRR